MKKIIFAIFIFVFLLLINSTVLASDTALILSDVNTLNFAQKIKSVSFTNIKEICSYDYCDYVSFDDINASLENFTKKYIATISDEEMQKIVLVKGIKITKLILYD